MQYLTRLLKEEHRRTGLYLEETLKQVHLKIGQRTIEKFEFPFNLEEIHSVADMWLAMEVTA